MTVNISVIVYGKETIIESSRYIGTGADVKRIIDVGF